MATFDSIFPNFLNMCGNLHTLLLSVAFALFIVGVIVTVKQHSSHKSIVNLLLRLLLLTSLLVFLPGWGNTLQNLLQTSILSGFKNSLIGCTHLSRSSARSPMSYHRHCEPWPVATTISPI